MVVNTKSVKLPIPFTTFTHVLGSGCSESGTQYCDEIWNAHDTTAFLVPVTLDECLPFLQHTQCEGYYWNTVKCKPNHFVGHDVFTPPSCIL